VGVFSLKSISFWPVWSSCFSAATSQTLSACWLAVFLLSVSACDWRVTASWELNELILFLKSFWLLAESSVGSVADLNGVWYLISLDKILGIWSREGCVGCSLCIRDLSWLSSLHFHGTGSAWVILVVHWVAGGQWGWLVTELAQGFSAWVVLIVEWVADSERGWGVSKLVQGKLSSSAWIIFIVKWVALWKRRS